jgi:uncharacterized protein
MLLTPIKVGCPNCRRKFETYVPISMSVFNVHTDFCPDTLGRPVHSCIHCGFAGSQQRFKRKVSAKVRELVAAHLKPIKWGSKSSWWRRFEHAARIAEWESRPPEEIANLYLGAAYECASNSAASARTEAAYRKKAVRFFQKSLDANEISSENVPNVTYLVGELYRRVGELEEAAVWLKKAEALAAERDDLRWLVMLAKQQRMKPKELIDRQ